MNINYNHINTYLWYGYLSPKEIPTWLDECITSENAGKKYTPDEAASIFDKIFDELVDIHGSGKHIIPLSGGFDSRAILGALLERLDASQIETVTFGAPGQLDYDIGLHVAKSCGVKSHALDLRSVQFTWDALLDSVRKSPWTYVPDGYFNTLAREVLSDDSVTVWSGFLGDPLTGSHLSESTTTDEARVEFVAKQRRTKGLRLSAPGYDPVSALPDLPEIENLPPYAALDLGVRQARCIAPIVTPASAWNSWDPFFAKPASANQKSPVVITPFTHPDWAGYWLSAPRSALQGQKLYLDMLNLKFPKLFSLPSKASMGLPSTARFARFTRKATHAIKHRIQKRAPWMGIRSKLFLNYLDYDEMFRTRKDYQETLHTAFDYLKTHQITPWLDLDKMRTRHMKSHVDYGDAFLVLIGLAANLSVENSK